MNACTLRATALLVLLACAACGNNAPAVQPPVPREDFKTVLVLLEDIYHDIRGMGIVRARQEADLSAEISGRIAALHRDIGDDVRADEIIVELESESRLIALEKKRAQLARSLAQLEKNERDRVKADSLFERGILSGTDHDSATLNAAVAEADLELARAELRAAEKEYRDTKITAPYSGTIALRFVEAGHFVTPGQRLLTLVDLSSVTVVISVSERDIAGVRHDSPVSVSIDSLPGASFAGTVHTIARRSDDASRAFPTEISVDNTDRLILPGMIARVSIRSTRPEPCLTIPHSAVSSVHGDTVVRVLLDGEPAARVVDLGHRQGERVIVRAGLEEGQQVVLPGIP